MEQIIGAFDAKTHFSEFLQRASTGEVFVFTKRGRPMAKLVPYAKTSTNELQSLLKEMRTFRKKINQSAPIR